MQEMALKAEDMKLVGRDAERIWKDSGDGVIKIYCIKFSKTNNFKCVNTAHTHTHTHNTHWREREVGEHSRNLCVGPTRGTEIEKRALWIEFLVYRLVWQGPLKSGGAHCSLLATTHLPTAGV